MSVRQNGIANGSFTKWGGAPGHNPQVADGWEIDSPNHTLVPKKCGLGQSDTTVHTGKYCQGWSGEKGDGIFQRIKVKPDTYYVITFWTRFYGPGVGMSKNWDYFVDALHYEVKGATGKTYCLLAGTGTLWTKMNVYFTTDKREQEVVFKCLQKKKGKYYINGVSMSKGTQENVRISDVVHQKIYEQGKKPSLTEWVNLARVPSGDLMLAFVELAPKDGGVPPLPTIYDNWFTERGKDIRQKYNVEFNRKMLKSSDNGKTWVPVDYRFTEQGKAWNPAEVDGSQTPAHG